MLSGLGSAETAFINEFSGTPWSGAADVFWTTLLDYLIVGLQALVVLGILLIIAGWFGGRTRIARAARGHITTGLAQIGGRLSDGRPGPMPRPMLPYAHWLIYAIGVAILLFSDVFSVSTVLWTAALVAGLITLAQLLAGPPVGAPEAGGTDAGAPAPATTTATSETGSMTSE